MTQKFKIFQFLFTIFGMATCDFPPACMRMLDKNIFLFDCCEYPVIPQKNPTYQKCLNLCSAFDYCCFQECTAIESGIMVDGRLNTENIRNIFAMQNMKIFTKFDNLTENWRKIVDESVSKCSEYPTTPNLKVCEEIYEFVACTFKENFLKCPNMKDKADCKDVKKDMEECSKSKGSWRFITDAFNTVKPRTYARRYAETIN